MKVTYLWLDKSWKNFRDNDGYWIGNPAVESLFVGKEIEYVYGSYAAVRESAEAVYLFVDLICSYPLFYYVKNETIIISDDARMIACVVDGISTPSSKHLIETITPPFTAK